ncbi:protein of unknown function [Pseudomonas sp. JV551A1]|uniref:Uncharacterized protein n=1 Tax=Pseudomonas inefficax TaxID=2078786 RepID=A0AAQ1SSZ2_9PSED|nr:protein of unknown function [Pseudomonas sp. JV551A1]SPO60357.1 protein of unknown function [Pseudomonas inefficax]
MQGPFSRALWHHLPHLFWRFCCQTLRFPNWEYAESLYSRPDLASQSKDSCTLQRQRAQTFRISLYYSFAYR